MNHVVLMPYFLNSFKSRGVPTSPANIPCCNRCQSRLKELGMRSRNLPLRYRRGNPHRRMSRACEGVFMPRDCRDPQATYHPATASTSTPNETKIRRGILSVLEAAIAWTRRIDIVEMDQQVVLDDLVLLCTVRQSVLAARVANLQPAVRDWLTQPRTLNPTPVRLPVSNAAEISAAEAFEPTRWSAEQRR